MSDAPTLPSRVKEPSLDEQIDLAEMQVVIRDLRIRRRTGTLVRRVRHEAIRHAGGGLVLGVGTVALTWWLNRLGRKHAAPAAPAPAAAPTEPPSTFEHLFGD